MLMTMAESKGIAHLRPKKFAWFIPPQDERSQMAVTHRVGKVIECSL